jgi:hypothetical protein
MPPQNQKSIIESLNEKYRTAQWLSQIPALTIMVWLRRDLGFRMVSPIRTIPICLFLIVVSAYNGSPDEPAKPNGLTIFAVLTIAISLLHYFKGWIDYSRRIKRHSYCMGASRLEFKRTPAFLRVESRMERFVDPIFAVLAGLALLPVSHALGVWLLISGMSLRAYQYSIYIRDRHLSLDIMDGMARSEQQTQIYEEFEAKSAWHKDPNSAGLSTGLDEEIERQITISLKRRKSKPNKNTIDI